MCFRIRSSDSDEEEAEAHSEDVGDNTTGDSMHPLHLSLHQIVFQRSTRGASLKM